MNEQFNNRGEDSSSFPRITITKFKKPEFVEEKFDMRREDIQIPDDIIRQIESGEYDGYNKEFREYYRSRFIAVVIFLAATLICLGVASLGKKGFEYGKFFGILAIAYVGSTILILTGSPFPKKPRYSNLSKSERKRKHSEMYLDNEYYRLKSDFDRQQKILKDERYDGIRINIESLFTEMALIFYFRDKVHLLNYRTWLSLGIHGVYDNLQAIFEQSAISVLNHRPFFILEAEAGKKICGLYFSYSTVPLGMAIVEKINRLKQIHLVDEVYLITVDDCTEKVLMKLKEAKIGFVRLTDLVSSFYYALKFDKIFNQMILNELPESRISLKKLYEAFSSRSVDYMEHLFDLATRDFEDDLVKKSERYTNKFLNYLKWKFETNPFAEHDEIDLRIKGFQNILKYPVTLQLPFYNYHEFEVMNSSKPYGYMNWSPYPRYEKGTVIIK